MSTITLTNQHHQQTTSFQYGNCGNSLVYLNGLQEGESILFEDPYLIQNSNGIIAGIDQRFTLLKHVRNTEVVDTLKLSWSDSCTTQSDPVLIASGSNSFKTPSGSIELIVLVVSVLFAVLMIKIKS